MKLSVAQLQPHAGGPGPFPGSTGSRAVLSPFAGSRQVSAFPVLNRGWIPA